LDAELKNKPAHYRHAARALLHLILVDLARLLEPAEIAMDDDPALQAVFSFIDAQFREPISPADVARFVGRTPGHLTTIVRRKTGLTVEDWIAEWLTPGRYCKPAHAKRRMTYRLLAVTTIQATFSDRSRKCMEPHRHNGAETSTPISRNTKNPPIPPKYHPWKSPISPLTLKAKGRNNVFHNPCTRFGRP
jgi:AraC-like DNA-binding protein